MSASPRGRLRRIYLLPNLFTAFNLALGLMGIFNLLDGNIKRACWYIVVAAVFDCVDGAVARVTHTESEFGLQFDSLSDLVSFGVAPAVLLLRVVKDVPSVDPKMAVGASLLFAVCGAVRLARYNVQAKGSERKGFLGLPIPGGAMCVVLPIFTLVEHGRVETPGLVAMLPIMAVGISLLMVSEVPYPSLIKHFRIDRRMPLDSLISFLVILMLFISVKSDLRVTIFCVLGYCYVLFGLLSWGVARMRVGAGDGAQ